MAEEPDSQKAFAARAAFGPKADFAEVFACPAVNVLVHYKAVASRKFRAYGNWNFAPIADAGRRRKLETAPSYRQIAQDIASSLHILCTHPDPCDEAAGYTRLVSCVTIEPELFDLFFNSESGYRGGYFLAHTEGLRANSHILGLVALVAHTSHPSLPHHQAEWSLTAESAKCWLAEVGKGFCPACEGEWACPQDSVAEILNERWELGNEPKARYGRKAPRLTKLRFLGAFVDKAGKEYVTTQKRERADHIFKFGWS